MLRGAQWGPQGRGGRVEGRVRVEGSWLAEGSVGVGSSYDRVRRRGMVGAVRRRRRGEGVRSVRRWR